MLPGPIGGGVLSAAADDNVQIRLAIRLISACDAALWPIPGHMPMAEP